MSKNYVGKKNYWEQALTPRQRHILDLVERLGSERLAAEELGISKRSVNDAVRKARIKQAGIRPAARI